MFRFKSLMPKKVAAYHLGEMPYSSPKIVTATNEKIRKALFNCMMPSISPGWRESAPGPSAACRYGITTGLWVHGLDEGVLHYGIDTSPAKRSSDDDSSRQEWCALTDQQV